jgi:hypothetical protein
MDNLPVDHFVKSQQFVRTTHRDVYPAIEPTQASLSQKGKVVIVTGASQGLGARVSCPATSLSHCTSSNMTNPICRPLFVLSLQQAQKQSFS